MFPVVRKYLRICNFPVVRKKIYGSVSEAGEFGRNLEFFEGIRGLFFSNNAAIFFWKYSAINWLQYWNVNGIMIDELKK